MNARIDFPYENEYPPYAEMYMKLIQKDGSLLKQLSGNLEQMKKMVASLTIETMTNNIILVTKQSP